MMSELPEGWATASLGELAEFEMGQAPPGAKCNTNGVGTVFVKAGEFGREHPVVREWTTQPLKFARAGDVLICVVGATSGKLNLGIDCAIGRSVAAIRPKEAIQQKTLYRQLLLQVEQLRADSTGTAQGVISKQMLSDINLVLPPLSEQTRIADQLDKLLARIQTCNDRIDAIPALLKRFRQAVLTAATSGALTEDLRAQREARVARIEPSAESGNCVRDSGQLSYQVTPTPDSDSLHPGYGIDRPEWRRTTIGAVAIDLRYGTSKKCDYSPMGTGVLRIPNIGERGRIDVHDLKRAEFDVNELQKLALLEGDLLVIRSNGSVELVGKTGLVTAKELGLLFAGYLMRLRVDLEKALPGFIQIWLSAPLQRQYIERTAKSTSGVNNLNAEELRALPLRLPSLEEQREIVRRVEALFKLADRIEARYKAARAQAQRLTPLLLAKAFRGELAPQDPNDESAGVLLERIRAQHGEHVPRAARRGRKANTV